MMNPVIYVVDHQGNDYQFAGVDRFKTEDATNNLLLLNPRGELLHLFAEGKWTCVGVRERNQQEGSDG